MVIKFLKTNEKNSSIYRKKKDTSHSGSVKITTDFSRERIQLENNNISVLKEKDYKNSISNKNND